MSKALVVEDESGIRALLVSLLEDEGYEVQATGDGHKAAPLAAEHHPDVVLLDVMLPGMDGREVHRQLRDLEGMSHTPIVFMSAGGHLRPGGDSHTTFMAKPFDVEVLLQHISSLLAPA